MSDAARPFPTKASRGPARALRNWLEERAQYIEDLARAIAEERAQRSREAFESRAQEAGIEAKAYAAQGLHVHGSALRALGRAVANLTRQNLELARERDALTARLAKCEAEIERIARRASAEAPAPGAAAEAAGEFGASAAAEATKLHFDASRSPLPGYLNIDLSSDGDARIFAPVTALNIQAGSLREIVASEVVELVSPEVFSGSVLPYWRDCLADDARLVLTCRDGEALRAHAGEMSFAAFRAAVFAGENGGAVRNLVTPEQLQAMLERAGFVDVEVPFRGQRRANGFLFQVAARKSAR